MSRSKNIKAKVTALLRETQPAVKAPEKKPAHLKTLTVIALITVTTMTYGAYAYFTSPRGKITVPQEGSNVPRLVEIHGVTKNLPPARHYIWVAVDLESLGRCWPKRQVYKPNASFETMIHETGPTNNFVVSLYAVDRDYHDKIQNWFEEVRRTGSEIGMPILPEDYRLDSISLTLNDM